MKSWRRCSLHLQIQTTRGTREGVFFFGKFVVTHGASHHTVITAFSGETEYHSTAFFGLSALRGEADNVVKTMYIHVDATAVAGIAQTHVSCRMKHIAVKQLWLQEKVRYGLFANVKIVRCGVVLDVAFVMFTFSHPHQISIVRLDVLSSQLCLYKWVSDGSKHYACSETGGSWRVASSRTESSPA